MAKKSAIYDEYIITQEDNGSIRVCQIFDNVIGSLREAAAAVKFKFDPKWNTQTFGREMVKAFGDGTTANVDEYTIVRRDNGSIETYRVHGNTIKVLRKIGEMLGLAQQPTWFTRMYGSKIIDFINGDYKPEVEEVEVGLVATPEMGTLDLQKAFEAMFGGHLRIKQGVKRCDVNKRGEGIDIPLSELGLKERTVFSPDLTVGDFIAQAKDAGMSLQVATNDDWVTALDGFALDFVGQIPNNTTKDKMEAILNR